MKNRVTNEPLFVVIFTLIPKEEVEKKGGEKAAAAAAAAPAGSGKSEDVD